MKLAVIAQRGLKSSLVVYKKITTSIAFIPAVIVIFFLFLSYFIVQFDFSETGKAIKANAHWLTLKDASTARSIISTIAGGVISLTVFSFSMVMILLNQAASQMSNRILDKLIGNRFQQTILGFYIGTIVYALFLLSTIRDINSGIYVPAISTYLLIAFTVIDIFLFIYFLHYVTQSVKYETIIQQIYDTTRRSLEHSCFQKANTDAESTHDNGGTVINAYKSGIFQGFLHDALLSLCTREKLAVSFLYPVGSSVIQNTPFLRIRSQNDLSEDTLADLNSMINIHRGQDIGAYYYYGFRQLTEVAVKALSPGINDPGTAILSLQALSRLFAFRLQNFPVTQFRDEEEVPRILIKERSFSEIFKDCIYPIWDYGKNDRLLNSELHHTLIQLTALDDLPVMSKLLTLVQNAIKAQNKA